MPSRIKYMEKYLPNILDATKKFKEITKICLIYDDDISEKDFNNIKKFENLDSRIEIILNDKDLKVCNKECGIINKYGFDIPFITLDDDEYYNESYISSLIEYHNKFNDKIICIDSNCLYKKADGYIETNSKYPPCRIVKATISKVRVFSICALYPKGFFRDSKFLDKNFIINNHFTTHDEMLVTCEALRKNVDIVTLNTSLSTASDTYDFYEESKNECDERLNNKNCCTYTNSKYDWNKIVTDLYGEYILYKELETKIIVENENALSILYLKNVIEDYYHKIGHKVTFVPYNLNNTYKGHYERH